jgi:hypothetical protein
MLPIGLRPLLTDRVVDPAEESIDVAIQIGSLAESSMIAPRIGSAKATANALSLSSRG